MIAGSILGYIALFFILKYMSEGDYGLIGFGMAYVGLFAFISDFGFNAAHVKRVSEGEDLEKCVGTFFVIKLVITGIMQAASSFPSSFGNLLWAEDLRAQSTRGSYIHLFCIM